MSAFALYRRLLQTPQLRRLIVLGLVARLPIGILSIALVLFLREQTGSFAQAGAGAAAFALAGGLFSPLQGRAVDRIGQTRVLVPLAVVHAGALAGVLALGLAGAPIGAVAGLAAVAGAAVPPVSACVRPLLIALLDHDRELLPAGYAVDSIALEVVFIAGPLLTAVLVEAFSPAIALAAGAAFALGGTLAFAVQPVSRTWRGEGITRGIAGALASPGIRTMALAALPIGVCFGTLEVTLPAFGAEHGAASLAGLLFAVLSIGSAAGGIAYGIASARLGSIQRGYLLLLGFLPLSLALLALPHSVALMIVLVPFGGCVIAPITAAESRLATEVAPSTAATEAYTWLIMATVLGVALGNAAAGALVQEAGWRTALLASCAVAAAGAAVSIARRATLRIPAAERA